MNSDANNSSFEHIDHTYHQGDRPLPSQADHLGEELEITVSGSAGAGPSATQEPPAVLAIQPGGLPDQQPKGGPATSKQQRANSQRDTLLELSVDASYFQDLAGDSYATVVEDGRPKTLRVGSTAFKNWLLRLWMQRAREESGQVTAPSSQAIGDAIAALAAQASQGPVHMVFVRIGYADGKIYVDLGDPTYRAVEITAAGWRVVDHPPVRFVRPSGMLALPEPVRSPAGRDALLSILPDGTDATDAKILLLTFLSGTFLQRGALPLLGISGRQGSGKTTLVRRLRALIDPNQAPARQQPRTEDDLIIAARNGALVCFDNLSFIDAKLSDALCRIATGAGFSKRRLYSDLDEVIVEVRWPVIINGIVDLIRMPDLADRALVVELPARASYEPLETLEAAFERDRPIMLGALYDAVSAALGGYRQQISSPGIRLADLERWACAALQVFGYEPSAVSATLLENRTKSDRMLVEDDLTSALLLELLERTGSFEGPATELLSDLRQYADPADLQQLPKNARALSAHLNRFVQPLERIGITMIRERGPGAQRERLWVITLTGAQAQEPFAEEEF